MKLNYNIFLKKKILIYGLGKSGLSAFNFLKNKSNVFLFDDSKLKDIPAQTKKKFITFQDILNFKFDKIILSPGIDINKCKLSNYLKKNYSKICSDLDVFYSFYKNDCITITGTNGKSTTCQLLYEILLKHNLNVKLVGNIGNPILSVKNVKKKTLFIIEASSYQLEYSKIFKSKYAVILNLSPDHIERHHSLNKYVNAKFKLLKNQTKNNIAFVKKKDSLIEKKIKNNNFKSKIIKVNTFKKSSITDKIKNTYFFTETNKENLAFVLAISKKFNLKKTLILKVLQNFRGLEYRQQIVYKKNNLTIINDSKSTSFSSSVGLLKTKKKIYWLVGGIHKKKDKFNLEKKYFKNKNVFIFGSNRKFFNEKLKNKMKINNFKNLDEALKKVLLIIKKEKNFEKIILFSPCAASFDSFKNFEERGIYFNNLIKKYLYGKQKIII